MSEGGSKDREQETEKRTNSKEISTTQEGCGAGFIDNNEGIHPFGHVHLAITVRQRSQRNTDELGNVWNGGYHPLKA